MNNFKNFDIDKAKEASIFFEARYVFLTNLINEQSRSANKSIVGTKIIMHNWFERELVESILNDLGYTLTFYTFGFKCGFGCSQFTQISFVPKDSQTTEGN